jgi:hypothetical protein
MRTWVVLGLVLCCVFNIQIAGANQSVGKNECKGMREDANKVVPVICFNNKLYEIRYRPNEGEVVLKHSGIRQVLIRIPKKFDPVIVGAEAVIGFLPGKLQVYGESNILMYVTSMRTSGGNGGGQCGAGAEIYLNFLDVAKPVFRSFSRILIGSCEESIELDGQNIPRGELGSISVHENKIRLEFFNYKDMDGYPVGTISDDFIKLNFK